MMNRVRQDLLPEYSPPGPRKGPGRGAARWRSLLTSLLSWVLVVLIAAPLQQPVLAALQTLMVPGSIDYSSSEEDDVKDGETKDGKWTHSTAAASRSGRRRQPGSFSAVVSAHASPPVRITPPTSPDHSASLLSSPRPCPGRVLPLRC